MIGLALRSSTALTSPKIAPLDGRGQQDLRPAAAGVGGFRSIVLVPGELPDLLEDGPGCGPAEHADQQADRFPGEFAHDRRPRAAASQHRKRLREAALVQGRVEAGRLVKLAVPPEDLARP